jgi:hypothetical protein
MGFFGRAVFESLMEILVRHEDDDRSERVTVHFHSVAPRNSAADHSDKLIFKFQMIVLRIGDRAFMRHVRARRLRRGIRDLCGVKSMRPPHRCGRERCAGRRFHEFPPI